MSSPENFQRECHSQSPLLDQYKQTRENLAWANLAMKRPQTVEDYELVDAINCALCDYGALDFSQLDANKKGKVEKAKKRFDYLLKKLLTNELYKKILLNDKSR